MAPSRSIVVAEAVEAIRARTAFYLGEPLAGSTAARLVDDLLKAVVEDEPAPEVVRLTAWRDHVVTVAFLGAPLPTATVDVNGVPHSSFYRLFYSLGMTPERRGLAAVLTLLNALSERLLVVTYLEPMRYRAVFARGGVVGLLSAREPETTPVENNSFTFIPDMEVLRGELTLDILRTIVESAREGSAVEVTFEDRSDVCAEWR